MFTPQFSNTGTTQPANDLAGIYQNQLGRAPDAAGLAFYQGLMDNGTMTLDQIRSNIAGSSEAQGYQQSGQTQQQNIFDKSSLAFDSAMKMLTNRPTSAPTVSAPTISAGQLSNTDLSPYMNPYTQAVTDQSLAGLDRARMMAMNGTDAAASGAFGGSRHGVMQGETNTGFADASARTLSGLNMDNFTNAQAAAFQDIQNNLSANQANASNSLNASIGNANAAQAFDSANMSAAAALAQLSNLGFGQGQSALDAQMQAGSMQQGIMQQIIDAGQAQSTGQTGFSDEAMSRLLAAVGGVPSPTSTEQSSSPGVMGLLTAFL